MNHYDIIIEFRRAINKLNYLRSGANSVDLQDFVYQWCNDHYSTFTYLEHLKSFLFDYALCLTKIDFCIDNILYLFEKEKKNGRKGEAE